MHGYIANFLSKFQRDNPKHPQESPSKYVTHVYSTKTQYADTHAMPRLTAKQCLNIQKLTVSVLHYAMSVDPTVCMPLNDIATEQTKATEKTQGATDNILYYRVTHPDDTIRNHASNMFLRTHRGVS
jgi:hypothetical protein